MWSIVHKFFSKKRTHKRKHHAGRGNERIYLTGMMGSGKTTVGKILAQMLKTQWMDSDLELTKNGESIKQMFEIGEVYFRDKEHEWLKSTLDIEQGVFSTGGGVVVLDLNREILKEELVFYLHADIETLEARLKEEVKGRPLLVRGLRSIYAHRKKFYAETATYTVDTNGLTPEQVAHKIADMV